MAKGVKSYINRINAVLKALHRDTASLTFQVKGLASAMRTLDLANAQIDGLKETTVWEETRYGRKLAPHPVFKVRKDAEDSVTRQMKALGLTYEMLMGTNTHDPLIEVTEQVLQSGKGGDALVVRKRHDGRAETANN